jgi:large subunit ribosomal protein L15
MGLSLDKVKQSKGATKTRKRIGRGNASGTGTYSGRGLKGQRSRSGGKGGLKLKGFKRNLLNLPKFKGQKSIKPNNQVVDFTVISKFFKDGDVVSPKTLEEKGVLDATKGPVKVLNNGELSAKITVENCLVSATAQAAIEKAGGSIKPEQAVKETKKPSTDASSEASAKEEA